MLPLCQTVSALPHPESVLLFLAPPVSTQTPSVSLPLPASLAGLNSLFLPLFATHSLVSPSVSFPLFASLSGLDPSLQVVSTSPSLSLFQAVSAPSSLSLRLPLCFSLTLPLFDLCFYSLVPPMWPLFLLPSSSSASDHFCFLSLPLQALFLLPSSSSASGHFCSLAHPLKLCFFPLAPSFQTVPAPFRSSPRPKYVLLFPSVRLTPSHSDFLLQIPFLSFLLSASLPLTLSRIPSVSPPFVIFS